MTPPQGVQVPAASAVAFNVAAGGTEPLSCHWLKDGQPVVNGGKISGATTASLTLSNVQASDMGAYSVVVSNAYGTAASAEAELSDPNPALDGIYLMSVNGADRRRFVPRNAFTNNGVEDPVWLNPTQLLVSAYPGDLPCHSSVYRVEIAEGTLQWVFAMGDALPGRHEDGVTDISPDGLQWLVRAQDGCWSPMYNIYAYHSVAGIWSTVYRDVVDEWKDCEAKWSPVGNQIAFTRFLTGGAYHNPEYPAVATIRPDGTGFRVLTGPTEFCHLQSWSPDGAGLLFLETSAHGHGVPLQPANLWLMDLNGTNRQQFTFFDGFFPGDDFNGPRSHVDWYAMSPAIASAPEGTNCYAGATVTFRVAAWGGTPLHYQWRFNGAPLATATEPTLTLSPVRLADASSCSVIVSNDWGTVTASPPAVLVVQPPLSDEYTFVTLAGPFEQGRGAIDGVGLTARFRYPRSMAVDSAGNLYVADRLNHTIRKITPAGGVTTLAGLAEVPGGADGQGSAARFNEPKGVAVDAAGNVYVADTMNSTIRKITRAGLVTTVAGLAGVSGAANGRRSNARFNQPRGIVPDAEGNLYVGDTMNHTLRKIDPSGQVSTLAGLVGTLGTADGPGTVARFNQPRGLALDTNGNLYVADSFNHTIRKVTPDGVVTTLAGVATSWGSEDGPGNVARFRTPLEVDLDAAGNLYVTDNANHTIRRVGPDGYVTTIAGLPGSAGTVDGVGSAARLWEPAGLAVDAAGNVFVSEYTVHLIRSIAPDGRVTIFAGMPWTSGSADGTNAVARFNYPAGIETDADGTVYVADTHNHTLRTITPRGVVSTFAGAVGAAGYADGLGSAARFNYPYDPGADFCGDVFVADSANYCIRRVVPNGQVSTFAGSPGTGGYLDGIGLSAQFRSVRGVVADPQQTLYVADTGNHAVRKITPAAEVTTLAGRGGVAGFADGTGTNALFNEPRGMALDGDGNLIVSDTRNHTIRKVTPAGTVTTMAGSPGNPGFADGVGSDARFREPHGVAVDRQGNVWVADDLNNAIRKIDPAGVVTTVGGNGTAGAADGTGSDARFGGPWGIAVNTNGTLCVTDTDNNTIRISVPTCPDMPVIDESVGPVGALRQLDAAPSTAIAWNWTLIRRPSGSTSELSSVTVHNPTFTPDAADLYGFRLRATNAMGGICIRTLSFEALATEPPTLLASPPNAQAVAGRHVTLQVAATGLGPIRYQWRFKGQDIIGATQPELTLTNVQASDAGNYVVVVWNDYGATTSAPPAVLTVLSGEGLTEEYSFGTWVGQSGRGPGFFDGMGIEARFSSPRGLAVDTQGHLYVADHVNQTIRKITPDGWVTTLAGRTGLTGSTDAAGSAARFCYPMAVEVDAGGNVFVADLWTHTIRRISPAGEVITVAGQPWQWGAVDGPALEARFWNPFDVAVAPDGALYVVEEPNHAVRKIAPNGIVTTLAGEPGVPGFSDGQGHLAHFNQPRGIALDREGNLFVTDAANHTVRRISPDGQVTTLAGQAGMSGSADGLGAAARFAVPWGIAVDSSGFLVVADHANHTLRRIAPNGNVTTWAGQAGVTGSTDGSNTVARFYYPVGLAVDASGSVYVTESENNTIRRVDPNGTVSTIAGQASLWGTANGIARNARFNSPRGLALDLKGNVLVADHVNHTIRQINAAGTVTIRAGRAGSAGSTDGPANAARFLYPSHAASERLGNVYVADTGNHTVRKITAGGDVITLAGLAGAFGSVDGLGPAARFYNPRGLAVSAVGDVFVADSDNHTIRRITPEGLVTTVAGLAGSPGTADGVGSAARFYYPLDAALDPAGNLLIADPSNHAIRRMSPSGDVTTLAGLPGVAGWHDARGPDARFNSPSGLAVDSVGTVFVVDFANVCVRRINLAGDVTTLGGYPATPGSVDGTAAAARFSYAYRIAVDNAGNLIVADSASHVLRKSLLTCPDQPILDQTNGLAGVLRQLDTTPQTAVAWQWRVIRRPLGSTALFSDGHIRNPTFTPDVADLYVFRLYATNGMGAVSIRDAELFVTSPPVLVAQPQSQTVGSGGDVVFSVTAPGTAPLSYQWRFNGADMPGATNASLRITGVQSTHAGEYVVVVSNAWGVTVSASAILNVPLSLADALDALDWSWSTSGSTTSSLWLAQAAITHDGTDAAQSGPVGDGQSSLLQTSVEGPGRLSFWWKVSSEPETDVLRFYAMPILQATLSGEVDWQPVNIWLGVGTKTLRWAYSKNATGCAGIDGGWVDQVAFEPGGFGPLILQEPTDQIVVLGSEARLVLHAGGTPPLSYQWYREGQLLAGQTVSAVVLTNVGLPDGGCYSVVVSNAWGVVTSTVANLTIAGAPGVLVNGCVPVTNLLAVAGPATVELQTAVPGGWMFYSLGGEEPREGRLYVAPFTVSTNIVLRATVATADFTRWAESGPYWIEPEIAPVITSHAQSLTVAVDTAVSLSVAARGNPPPAYSWFHDNQQMPGQTQATLSWTQVGLSDSGTYTVLVWNTAGAVLGPPAQLTVLAPPGVTTLPPSQSVPLGGSVTFQAVASGSDPLTHQWRKNGVNIANATNASFAILSVQLSDGGSYSVVVANPIAAVASEPAFLLVEVPAAAPPSTDAFADRRLLSGGIGYATGTVAQATREVDEPYHAGKYGTNSVWYEWTAPAGGIATFKTIGSTFDTLLAIYTGSQLAELVPVADDEDRGGALTSELQFNAQAGVAYPVAIDGFAGEQGDFVLSWQFEPTDESLPVITVPPASQTVPWGATAELQVQATESDLSYQWHFNQEPIPGATGATFTLAQVNPAHVGSYTVAITNRTGRGLLSPPAIIEIGPLSNVQSQDKVEDVFFPIPAGAGPLLVPGRRGIAAAGAGAPGFVPVTVGTAGAQVFNTTGAQTQSAEAPPCGVIGSASKWFGLQPLEDGVLVIDTVGSTYDTVLAVYTGTNSVRTLQTVACDNNGAADQVRSRVSFLAQSGTLYSVAVDGVLGACGTTVLNWQLGWPATIVVTCPTHQMLKRGDRVELSIAVTGADPPAQCQWYRGWTLIAGATNSVWAVTNVQPADAGVYRVVASNAIGVVQCDVASLTVDPASAALASSTFDLDLEEWTVAGAAGNPRWQNGVALADDLIASAAWFWVAPVEFLGDQSAAYGGWLQFDVWHSATAAQPLVEATVRLAGGGLNLSYYSAEIPGTNPRTYRIPLRVELGWRRNDTRQSATASEMQSVLGALTSLQIRGSFVAAQGVGGLDNVAFVSPCTDVVPFLEVSMIEGGAALELAWPVNAGEFVVERSDHVAGAAWVPVAPRQHAVVGCRNQVTFDVSPGRGFYRLNQQ
ncbi:MAG: immunoglobulin domain-containing protein [Verrucomicrobia bacterium]|nr:immunoglobulin domain-containing protein [Verrucomicrobiota bacterium]